MARVPIIMLHPAQVMAPEIALAAFDCHSGTIHLETRYNREFVVRDVMPGAGEAGTGQEPRKYQEYLQGTCG